MKISTRMANDLLTLIDHAKRDISYGEGDSYNKENASGQYVFDATDAKAAERAMEFIKDMILSR